MKHTHKYLRTDLASKPGKHYFVYRCTLPTCNHYIRQELVFGKLSVCWSCNVPFTIIRKGTRPFKKKFVCENCWNKKYASGTVSNDNEDALNELLGIEDNG